MRSWQLAAVCLVCLTGVGCRANPNIAMLEQENRQLEDEIFRLQALVDDQQRTVDVYSQEHVTLGDRSGSDTGATDRTAGPSLLPEGTLPELKAWQSPTVEMPSSALPSDQIPDSLLPREPTEVPNGLDGPQEFNPPGQAPLDMNSPRPMSQPEDAQPVPTGAATHDSGDDRQAARIVILDRLTGGYNMDGSPGDEGISLVIQPQNAAGQPINAPAAVSVVALDPAVSGEAARVARWDFAAEQIAQRYCKTLLGNGIHLEMIWPDRPPLHGRLHVFARYATDDGRRLEADRQITVEVTDELARRNWPPDSPGTNAQANQTAPRWQGRPTQAPVSPSPESPRVASRPSQPITGPALVAPPQSASSPQRPVWSPNRP